MKTQDVIVINHNPPTRGVSPGLFRHLYAVFARWQSRVRQRIETADISEARRNEIRTSNLAIWRRRLARDWHTHFGVNGHTLK